MYKALSQIVAGLSLFAMSTIACAQERLPLAGVTLKVGVASAPPFIIIGESFNDMTGIDIDILAELQRRTGFKLENDRLFLTSFGEMMDLGKEGYLDICAGTISINKARGEIFLQSVPLLNSHIVLVTSDSSNISSVNQLNGTSIAKIKGSSLSYELSSEVAATVTINDRPSTFMTLYEVASDGSDVMLAEAPEAMGAIETWGKGHLEIAEHIQGTDSYMGYMFKKNSPYSPVLNEYLDQMRADGTVAKIILKYLPNYPLSKDLLPESIQATRASKKI